MRIIEDRVIWVEEIIWQREGSRDWIDVVGEKIRFCGGVRWIVRRTFYPM